MYFRMSSNLYRKEKSADNPTIYTAKLWLIRFKINQLRVRSMCFVCLLARRLQTFEVLVIGERDVKFSFCRNIKAYKIKHSYPTYKHR